MCTSLTVVLLNADVHTYMQVFALMADLKKLKDAERDNNVPQAGAR